MFFQWTRGVNKYRLSLKSKAKNKTSNYNFYKRRQKGKHSGFTYGLDGLYFRVGISNLWREKNCRTHGGGTMVQSSAALRGGSRPGQGDSQTPTSPGVWVGGRQLLHTEWRNNRVLLYSSGN